MTEVVHNPFAGQLVASNPPPNSPQNLQFERQDWSLFRTIEGLQQRAGVPKSKLRRLVLKELADGLDEGGNARVGILPDDARADRGSAEAGPRVEAEIGRPPSTKRTRHRPGTATLR
jgi:hypothetical protein